MISFREVTQDTWWESLQLTVHPEQLAFVSQFQPIAAIAMSKGYVRLNGMIWTPYVIYADQQMVGLIVLTYEPANSEEFWIYHFFIDQHVQGRGYGKQAITAFIQWLRDTYPQARQLNLTVHPENHLAQRLYINHGFRPTGAEQFGEPIYTLDLRAEQGAKGS